MLTSLHNRMHTIFQTDRILLARQMQKAAPYVRGKVLDIGSGSFLRYRDFFDFTAYHTLEADKKKNPDIVGSAEDIPVSSESYDTVISTQVLEHVPHPQKAVLEMYRVLRAGGYAVVTVPQWNELHEEPGDYWRYTGYGLEKLFSEAGFSVEALEPRGHFFAFLGQACVRFFIDRFYLYENPFWNAVLFAPLKIFGLCMLFLDRHVLSAASKKHTLGWFCVAKKP